MTVSATVMKKESVTSSGWKCGMPTFCDWREDPYPQYSKVGFILKNEYSCRCPNKYTHRLCIETAKNVNKEMYL